MKKYNITLTTLFVLLLTCLLCLIACNTTPDDPCKNGHNYVDNVCTVCKAEHPCKNGHSYVNNVCSVCKAEHPCKNGHSYVSGTCSVCQTTDPNYVPPVDDPCKNGHTYVNGVCSVCQNVDPCKDGHNYVDNVCTVCNGEHPCKNGHDYVDGICSVCQLFNPQLPHSNHSYSKVVDGNTFKMVCPCGDYLTGYRIQFVYAEDGSQAEDGIEVSWVGANGVAHTAQTDDFGYVEVLTLTEKSYKITVKESTLPVINGVEYKYNSNEFSTQTDGIGLIIPLMEIHEPLEKNEIAVQTGVTSDGWQISTSYYCYTIDLNNTYVATINSATDKVWFLVNNEGFGKYTIDATMASELNVTIDRYYGTLYYITPTPDENVDKSQHNKLTYKVVYTDATQTSMFCISVENATSYPVKIPFTVNVTYQAEDQNITASTMVTPTHFQTQTSQHVYYTTERGTDALIENFANSLVPIGIEKWADVEGSVIKDLTADQLTTLQLRDGFYYTSDNQLVYVKLKAPSIFDATTLAGFLDYSARFDIYEVTARDEYGCLIRWDNYFGFVQAYAALANSDGLYPLTKEMYDYLQIVATKEHQGVEALLCTYPSQTINWTEGNGSQSSPYVITLGEQTFGNYKMSLVAGGKVYLTLNGNMDVALTFNSNVKVTYGETTYNGEFVTVNGSVTVVFETKDGSALDFVVKVEEYNDPYYLQVGENKVEALPNAEIYYEFIAPTAGTYDISASALTVRVTLLTNIATSIEEGVVITDTYSITLTEGQSIYFITQTDMTTDVEFSLYVEQALE